MYAKSNEIQVACKHTCGNDMTKAVPFNYKHREARSDFSRECLLFI